MSRLQPTHPAVRIMAMFTWLQTTKPKELILMINSRQFGISIFLLIVGLLLGNACWAGDFSVDIKRVVDIDATRPLPEFKLDRVLIPPKSKPDPDMPSKEFDVFIRFSEFGSVRLDASAEVGPLSGKIGQKGMTYDTGLADLKAIKFAWIKNSPDLYVVAWNDEPDALGMGYAHNFRHAYTIMQLRHRQAVVLLRGSHALTAKLHDGIQFDVTDHSYFSFNASEEILQQRLTRFYEKSSDSQDLGHLTKGEDGTERYVASVDEVITLDYKLGDGKLQPWKARLVYLTQQRDELSQVARFYLGPFAPRHVLLEANANLAAKNKDTHPGAHIYLDKGTEISIPVPEKWLIDKFSDRLLSNRQFD